MQRKAARFLRGPARHGLGDRVEISDITGNIRGNNSIAHAVQRASQVLLLPGQPRNRIGSNFVFNRHPFLGNGQDIFSGDQLLLNLC